MATSNLAVSHTFKLLNSAGANVSGDLITAQVQPILRKECVLVVLGFIRAVGHLQSLQNLGIEGRSKATIKIPFPARSKWTSGFDPNLAPDKFKVDEMLINIEHQAQFTLERDVADSLLRGDIINIQSVVSGDLTSAGMKVLALEWYKNLIAKTKIDKSGATFNRFTILTKADMVAKPKKTIDAIIKEVQKIENLITNYSSFIEKKHIKVIVSKETMLQIVHYSGELGRTVEFIKNPTGIDYYDLFGVEVYVDPFLGLNIPDGTYLKTQSGTDFSKVHAIILTTRIQFLPLPMFQMGMGSSQYYPEQIKYNTGRMIWGLGFNSICSKEVQFIVEETAFLG